MALIISKSLKRFSKFEHFMEYYRLSMERKNLKRWVRKLRNRHKIEFMINIKKGKVWYYVAGISLKINEKNFVKQILNYYTCTVYKVD